MLKVFILLTLATSFGGAKMSVPTVGYVPHTFPRDPVDVNQFDEHIILGQVLQPLVETDSSGRVVPGVADSWVKSENGLEWKFHISKSAKFSNGKGVTSSDVVFTLRKHHNTKSQSSSFLTDIVSIEESGPEHIILRLREPSPGIIKVLSRDQLGILPSGWVFDSASSEPFIGTGPYRLKKNKDGWFLEKNSQSPATASVGKWRVLFYTDSKNSLPMETPDLFPSITNTLLSVLKREGRIKDYSIDERFSFSQTSFWVHPKSDFFKNKRDRAVLAQRLEGVILEFISEFSLKEATGAIPVGVPGHLNKRKKLEIATSHKPIRKVKIAYLTPIFDPFADFLIKRQKKYNLEVELKSFTPSTLAQIKEYKPDIVTGSWAGGFYDPMGFLPLTKMILSEPFESIIGDKIFVFTNAKNEMDSNQRSRLFREVNAYLIDESLMIPGWKQPNYSVYSVNISKKGSEDRYSPRLENFK